MFQGLFRRKSQANLAPPFLRPVSPVKILYDPIRDDPRPSKIPPEWFDDSKNLKMDVVQLGMLGRTLNQCEVVFICNKFAAGEYTGLPFASSQVAFIQQMQAAVNALKAGNEISPVMARKCEVALGANARQSPPIAQPKVGFAAALRGFFGRRGGLQPA